MFANKKGVFKVYSMVLKVTFALEAEGAASIIRWDIR